MKTAMIRARIEPKLKRNVDKLFDRLGLSASEAITIFYKQIELNKGLPFKIKIPNEVTEQTFKDTDSHKNLAQFNNAEELFDDLGI
jgi:addiction module antitoxin, RelB/DinJ family